ncbi:MAG TPA: hypothetical protein VH372_06785 [Actinospica sp.]|jgi:hypothetical protein|nr:hypothetical protein [Actinospica sp.]
MSTGNRQDVAETYVHFGPGVPTAPSSDRATAIWRAEELPEGAAEDPVLAARRRNQHWILPLTVLILVMAVVIYFLWGRDGSTIAVSGVSVQGSVRTVDCGGTERLNGVVTTNGGSGEITYKWMRSDGTTSDTLRQAVSRGTRRITVTLDWNFQGYGTLDATATLHMISPGGASASASFAYACARPSSGP